MNLHIGWLSSCQGELWWQMLIFGMWSPHLAITWHHGSSSHDGQHWPQSQAGMSTNGTLSDLDACTAL